MRVPSKLPVKIRLVLEVTDGEKKVYDTGELEMEAVELSLTCKVLLFEMLNRIQSQNKEICERD